MGEKFYKPEFIPAEARNLHRFKGATLKEVVEYLDLAETDEARGKIEKQSDAENDLETSIFDGFLDLLRDKGVRVSTPEWLQFLQVIRRKTGPQLKELVNSNELLNKVRIFAMVTLLKDRADESIFHEAFDEYFEMTAKIYSRDLQQAETKKEEERLRNIGEMNKQKKDAESEQERVSRDSETKPKIKEQLGVQEVEENLNSPEGEEHQDDEKVHGGKEDQHNDILKKEDLSKQGGGDKKEGPSGEGDNGQPSEGEGDKDDKANGRGDKGEEGEGKGKKGNAGAGQGNSGEASAGEGDKGEAGKGRGDKGKPSGMGKGFSGLEMPENGNDSTDIPETPKGTQQEGVENGYLVGGGKGNAIFAKRILRDSVFEGVKTDKQAIQEREIKAGRVDRRIRYEERPNKSSMQEVIRNIRKIILDVSDVKSKEVDLKKTVGNFARRDFRFDYNREREKQPELVLLIDVGGPVDEWSPLVKEVAEAMTKGLTKLEIYLFHNNLYGYVWKPTQGDLLASSYAEPNSLIDLKTIIKKRKKVIIYGDAEMSYSEFKSDYWQPDNNRDRVERFGMGGEECLNFIKKKADSVVWINPVFQKEWEDRDDSGTIQAVRGIIPMHDLTVGGVEDAIKDLMRK